MLSIRGTIHDPEKKVSFVLELKGQKATQVYVWFRNSHYNETIMTIEDVPILMMRDTRRSANSNTGDIKECNKGKIFLGELHLENVAVMSVGTFFDREKMIHFEKQTFLAPDLTRPQVITGFLPNGVKRLSFDAVNIFELRRDNLRYPIQITEINDIRDLQMFPPGPNNDDDDQGPPQTGTGDSRLMNTTSSEVLAGIPSFGHPAPQLRPASSAPYWPSMPTFQPLAASTNSPTRSAIATPHTIPQPAASKPPSPSKPRSASPRGSNSPGRASSRGRRSERIRELQAIIPDYYEPAFSPVKPKLPMPPRSQKRGLSQRSSPKSSPPKKRSSSAGAYLTPRPDLAVTQPLTFDLDNDLTPPESQNVSAQGSSNEAGSKVMQGTSSETSADSAIMTNEAQFIEDPSFSASRSSSITTHVSGSRQPSLQPHELLPGLNNSKVTLHTNFKTDDPPQHVIIDANSKGHRVQIMTFPPYDFRKAVENFFAEGASHDNPDFDPDVLETANVSIIPLSTSEAMDIEQVVHLDNSIVQEGDPPATSIIRKSPSATIEVISRPICTMEVSGSPAYIPMDIKEETVSREPSPKDSEKEGTRGPRD